MAKNKKEVPAAEKPAVTDTADDARDMAALFGKTTVRPVDPSDMMEVEPRDQLFDLYVARVAKAETVNTMRRDGRAIFRDAFIEARVALDVYLEQMGVKK